jgi:putative nucleotidyltransferase with HDIG domain/PAS domain S-box-containing protein
MLMDASKHWSETFDSMPYGVMLLDKEFNIVKTNDYISKLTGVPIKELINKKCYELYPNLNIENCPVVKSSKTLNTEITEFHDPKNNKYFKVYAIPILDEQRLIKTYVNSFIDITESKVKEKIIVESRDAFLNMLKDVDFSFKELKEVYQGLIVSFVNALDAKSPWTKGHSVRVTKYAVATAKELGLKESDIEPLNTAALLHDIGKIGTYDTVLDKPGKLTDEEFALVKLHPGKGADILSPIRQFQLILPIIRHHHERLDGRGYPDGLKGDEIPFLSRIIHVADSYDAMTADRPYRKAPGREFAISELKKYSGLQFDPDAAEAFIRYLDRTPEEKEGEHEAT